MYACDACRLLGSVLLMPLHRCHCVTSSLLHSAPAHFGLLAIGHYHTQPYSCLHICRAQLCVDRQLWRDACRGCISSACTHLIQRGKSTWSTIAATLFRIQKQQKSYTPMHAYTSFFTCRACACTLCLLLRCSFATRFMCNALYVAC